MPVASRAYSTASPSKATAKRRSQLGAQTVSKVPPPESHPHSVARAAKAAKAVPTGTADAGFTVPASSAAGAARRARTSGVRTANTATICDPPHAPLLAECDVFLLGFQKNRAPACRIRWVGHTSRLSGNGTEDREDAQGVPVQLRVSLPMRSDNKLASGNPRAPASRGTPP